MICDECQALYEEVGDLVRGRGVFEKVRRNDEALYCRARQVASNTAYVAQVNEAHDTVWVGLHTPDRWLSQSIEADLMHTGDKLEDLLEEELCDQGWEARLPVEHFRSEDKQFVFRSPLPLPAGQTLDGAVMIDRVAKTLLAYEACFRRLGDMSPSGELD